MHLSSVLSADEERFIVSGIRQSSDYSAGSVYWLGARQGTEDGDSFSWIDGSAVGYQGWPPYNDTEDIEDACLGVQVSWSAAFSLPEIGACLNRHCAVYRAIETDKTKRAFLLLKVR